AFEAIEMSPTHDQSGVHTGFTLSFEDVTARKREENAVRGAQRALNVFPAWTSSVALARDERHLLASACRALVQPGGYRAAWAAPVTPVTGRTGPVAQAGSWRGIAAELAPPGRPL